MRKILVLLLSFMIVSAGFAQSTVSGTITSAEDGETLPGAAVLVKGTSIGTISDIDGKYVISLPKDRDVIVVSFIGMKTQEITIGSGTSIMNVTMQSDYVELDKVVVTAIGITRSERELGYSVQEVGGDEIAGANETNVVSALSGKVAGVQVTKSSGVPGGGASITIRGNSSLTGSNQPLFIIDGIPIDNSHNYSGNPEDGSNNLLAGVANSNRAIDINPDDIATINVLKGPAATALYGIRASNGAIIITTKRGGKTAGKSMSVKYSTSVSFDQVNQLPELQTKYSQGFSGDYAYPSTSFIPSAVSWGALMDTLMFDTDGENMWDVNGLVVGQSDPTGDIPFTPYDNLGTFFETGVTYNNNLSLAGGGDFGNYYLSIGNSTSKGIVPNSEFQRTSVKLTADANLSEKVKATTSINYINSGGTRIQQGSNTSGIMLGLLRTPPSFDNANGLEDPVDNSGSYLFEDGSQRNYRGGGGYDNPYWVVNNEPFTDDVNRMIGFAQFDYYPLQWLSVTYRAGLDYYADRRKQFFEIGSRTLPDGQVFTDDHFNSDFNSDLLITAQDDLSEDLYGRITVGHNAFSTFHKQNYLQGDGLSLPGFDDMTNASTLFAREILNKKRTMAIYMDGNLAFRNYLYLNLTVRNEWSTSLPDGDNSFIYPAVSLGFDLTEALGIESDVLSYAKIRGSWAQVGNDAPIYSLNTVYTQASHGDGWTNGIFFPVDGVNAFAIDDVAGNQSLTPEQTSSYEFGADLRFFRNRLGLDMTYYKSNSKDQILSVPISAASGFISAVLNAGEIENKGIELVLNAWVVKTDDFNWNATVNFSRNQSTVIQLAEGVETLFLNGFEGTSSRAVAGEPYGTIFGGRWLRDDAGNLVIDDDEASPNYGFPIVDPEEGILGDPNPDWLMGITNRFEYKGIYLSALLDIRQGGDMWNGTKGALTFFGASKLTEDRGETKVFEGVAESDGSVNDIEVVLDENWYLGNGGGFGDQSEDFIQDAGWVRLRDVTLGYNLPSSALENSIIMDLGFYFSVTNVFLITDYDGIDPETNLTGVTNGYGLEYFNMPNTRTYTVGLTVGL